MWSSTGDAQWVIHSCGDARGPQQRFLQRPVWWRGSVSGQGGPLWVQHGFCLCAFLFPNFSNWLFFFFSDSDIFLLSFAVGETAAGKASRSLAQHIPGPGSMEGMKGAASGVVGELARARIALDERGQKLGELEERTAAMMASAESFSKHAHDVRICPCFHNPVKLFPVLLTRHCFLPSCRWCWSIKIRSGTSSDGSARIIGLCTYERAGGPSFSFVWFFFLSLHQRLG